MNETVSRVWPDVAIHPGEFVQDFYEDEEDIPVAKLADRSGLAESELWSFIDGDTAVTPAIAVGLSKALGPPSTFWENLQTNYELTKIRIEENKNFNLVPYRDFRAIFGGVSTVRTLVSAGDIPERFNKVEQARFLCDWLGIPNLDDYEERLLGGFQVSGANAVTNPAPTVAWLRRGELATIEQAGQLPPYSEHSFADAINQFGDYVSRNGTSIESAMREVCNEFGVAFVIPADVPGCELHSATRWLTPERPMIQLRARNSLEGTESQNSVFLRAAAHIIHRDPDYLDFGGSPSSDGRRDDNADEDQLAEEFAMQGLIPNEDSDSPSTVSKSIVTSK